MATIHRLPTRKRVLGTLAATAAATLIAGGGSAIAAPPNVNFGFDASLAGTIADKDGEGTGFTSVQPNKNGNQYVPANLDLAGGALSVLSTNGDAGGAPTSSNNNTQQNALQVEFDGTGGYTVSTILRGPLPVATAFQSAGIFVGPDQDNYVKLAAGIGPGNVPRLQLAKEANGPASVTTPAQAPAPIATANAIQLILTVTPGSSGGAATITASAVIDGVTTPVGTTTLSGIGTSADKAGIVTTSANGQPFFKTPYENFAVLPAGQVPPAPGGGGNQVVAFKAKRTVIRGTTGNAAGQPGLGVPGFGQFSTRTLPTSLATDPVSGHLYVATQFGKIFVFDLDAANNATLLNGGPINSIFNKPNTKFDGTPESQSGRQVTGIAFDPKPQGGNSVLYVTHSDPEIFEEAEPGQSSVDPKSGMLTRLVVNAGGQVVSDVDLIKGLPRSGENHGPNGMAFGPDGKLYVALGGNTNNGSQSKPFGYFPETPMSASVIKVDTAAIGTPAQPLDVGKGAGFSFIDPCQPGESVGAGCSAGYQLQGSAADNGTILGKVEMHATGFRNPYDLVWHTNGSLYTAENEANQNFGPTPGPTDKTPTGACPGPSQNLATTPDELFRIQPGGYHGHPNPSLGLCAVGGVPPIAKFHNNSSTTGLAEYTSNAFGNLLQGQLIAANYAVGDTLVRVKLSPDATKAVDQATLASGFKDPLDILVGKDGAIFVAEHSNSGDSFAQISVLEPIALSCPKPGSPNIDSDGDGFLDSVEAAAGTDFCNPADAPPDFDGDGIADAIDPDVDGDGVPDAVDQLQRDPTNGAGTTIPFVRDFNQSNSGGWFGTGFGGIQLSSKGGGPLAGHASAGGAGGFLSITATPGTSEGAANNQHNAFQQGFTASGPVEVSTVVTEPWASLAPQGRESAALVLGPNEDNFVRLAVHANGGTPVIELATEQDGVASRRATAPLPLPASKVTLMLNADPSTNRVRVRFRLGDGAVQTMGTLTIPASWLAAPALAGLATTRADSPKASISFIFDEFAIRPGTAVPPATVNDPDLPPPGTGPTQTTPTTQNPPKPPVKSGTGDGKVTLSIGQMRINQRISSAAIRRVATLEAFLEGRPAPRFPAARPATFRLTVGQMAINQRIAQAAVRRVDALGARLEGKKPPTPRRTSGEANFTLTATQMLINQRISQAAVRRVNALTEWVEAGARLP